MAEELAHELMLHDVVWVHTTTTVIDKLTNKNFLPCFDPQLT